MSKITAEAVKSAVSNKYPYLAKWRHAKYGNLFIIVMGKDRGLVIYNDSNDDALIVGYNDYIYEMNFEKVDSILLKSD